MGKTAGTTRSTSTTQPLGFQLPYAQQVLSEAQRLYQQPGPLFYPCSTVAGFDPSEVTAFQHLQRAAPLAASFVQDQAYPALRFALNAPDVANNPYVQAMAEAAVRPVMQQLQEQVFPTLRQEFTAAGGRGGTREGMAAALATERAARAAADATTNLYGQAYAQGLQAQQGALGLIPSVQAALLQPGYTLADVGEAYRQMEQARINEAIARWQYEQNLPYVKLAEYANLVRSPFGGDAVSDVTATPADRLNQIFSLILGGASVIPGLIDLIRGIFGGNNLLGSNVAFGGTR